MRTGDEEVQLVAVVAVATGQRYQHRASDAGDREH
jgi:hypothetical protein